MQRHTLPTLIFHGAGDVASMAKNAARAAAAIAGSRVEPYEGAPHGLFLTDPARFNRDLLGFIRSV
jgi:pimeloyl-ACP methyl ester carboxylesterase